MCAELWIFARLCILWPLRYETDGCGHEAACHGTQAFAKVGESLNGVVPCFEAKSVQ